ncbi:uncharacterized protein LOC133289203 [Gastrolobium bilobum]|uniref:uncharacterized protein LOC133289203 n=1 Tax=Gastrolobium bilobum TaxID=150636 RepID=UPI002AB10918|nr:uncharacterized protein LOC133289203 [Gastrolobium bilobum]XP_061343087.1 uncharacterized protein LOC133289203 [Gastrolobium bilobum]
MHFGYSRTVVICYQKIAYNCPDQSPNQYRTYDENPTCFNWPLPPQKPSQKNRKGPRTNNWRTEFKEEVEAWESHDRRCIFHDDLQGCPNMFPTEIVNDNNPEEEENNAARACLDSGEASRITLHKDTKVEKARGGLSSMRFPTRCTTKTTTRHVPVNTFAS